MFAASHYFDGNEITLHLFSSNLINAMKGIDIGFCSSLSKRLQIDNILRIDYSPHKITLMARY